MYKTIFTTSACMLAEYEWEKVNIDYQQLIVMELGFEIEEKYYSL